MIEALNCMLKKLFLPALIFITIKHGMALVLLITTVNKFDHFLAEHKVIYIEEYQHNDLIRQMDNVIRIFEKRK